MNELYSIGQRSLKCAIILPRAKDRFKLICWLIVRYDNLRGSIANRAAIVLSADAILLTATVLFLEKFLSNVSVFSSIESIIFKLSIGVTLILLAVSIYFATTGIANVWKISRDLYGPDMPQRDFFHPRDTVENTSRFQLFEKKFRAVSDKELTAYALGELWTVINAYHMRYQKLRNAIKFVIFSFIPFFLTLMTFLYKIA